MIEDAMKITYKIKTTFTRDETNITITTTANCTKFVLCVYNNNVTYANATYDIYIHLILRSHNLLKTLNKLLFSQEFRCLFFVVVVHYNE